MPSISVMILSVPSRMKTSFPALFEKLCKQADGKDVEIIGLFDNKKRTVGEKRNNAISFTSGSYVGFIDDDDDVKDDYIESILACVPENNDCILFESEIHWNGNVAFTKFGFDYEESFDGTHYFRKPDHAMFYKRDLVVEQKFEHIMCGEDTLWRHGISQKAKTCSRIEKPLYIYWYDPRSSETAVYGRKERTHSRYRRQLEGYAFSKTILVPLDNTQLADFASLYGEIESLAGPGAEILAFVDNGKILPQEKIHKLSEISRSGIRIILDLADSEWREVLG